MCMLTRRTQLLLDEERYSRLERRAAQTNRSVGAVIREAIDRALPTGDLTPDQALEHFRSAPRLGIDDPAELRREIDARYDEGE